MKKFLWLGLLSIFAGSGAAAQQAVSPCVQVTGANGVAGCQAVTQAYPLPVTVSGTPALPTGAATAANQTNGNQQTQVVGTVPLPTGAATSANQTNGNQVTKVTAMGLTPATTTAVASSQVLKASAGTLYGGAVTATVAGYLLIFNATSLPANGAVTPVKCLSVPAGQTVSFSADAGTAWTFSTGITLGYSTTGCYTLTASATAFFTGQFQ